MKSKNFLRRSSSVVGEPIRPVRSGRGVVEVISGSIGLTAILIYLYGYGVAIGIASNLNVDHSMLIGSPFDLFIFSGYGLPILVEKIFTALDKIESLKAGAAIFVFLVVIAFVLLVCVTFYFYEKSSIQFKSLPKRVNFFKVVWGRVLAVFFAVPVVTGGFVFFVPSIIKIVIASLIFVLFFPLGVGYFNGKQYSEKYIVSPGWCSVKLLKDDANLFRVSGGASCVRVYSINKDHLYKKTGRLVISTNDFVVIFDKRTGFIEKIPKSESLIQESAN